MATRPTWQGYLRLSLVSCPVALYTATSRGGEVHFNMLSKTTHNRIRMIPTDPETGPIDRSDMSTPTRRCRHYPSGTRDRLKLDYLP